jgi:hypothetical protein
MHEAVEHDVRVRAGERTEYHRAHAEILQPQELQQWHREAPDEREHCHDDQARDSGTEVRVKEAMNRLLLRQHVVERLDVDEHVGAAEREKAEVLRRCCVHQCGRPEVKGCEWHRVRVKA